MQNGYLDPSDLSDDDIASVLGLNTNASKQSKLELQAKLAAALRDKQGEKGQMAGAVYIPPSPVNTALDTYDHLSGILQGNSLPAQSDALDAQRQAKLEKFARMWFGKSKNSVDPGLQDQDPNAQDVPQQ
jgi:hypothetical protein